MWPKVKFILLWISTDDDDTQHDLFKSDDEAEPEEGLDEQQWRVKRYEREKFIQEQKVHKMTL